MEGGFDDLPMLAEGNEVSEFVVGFDKGIRCLMFSVGVLEQARLEEKEVQFVDDVEGSDLPEGVRQAAFL